MCMETNGSQSGQKHTNYAALRLGLWQVYLTTASGNFIIGGNDSYNSCENQTRLNAPLRQKDKKQ
jgi:hypothetical protein